MDSRYLITNIQSVVAAALCHRTPNNTVTHLPVSSYPASTVPAVLTALLVEPAAAGHSADVVAPAGPPAAQTAHDSAEAELAAAVAEQLQVVAVVAAVTLSSVVAPHCASVEPAALDSAAARVASASAVAPPRVVAAATESSVA